MTKIKILQINHQKKCDTCNKKHGKSCLNKFIDYNKTEKLNFDCYNEVYSYKIKNINNINKQLNKIYQKFNGVQPEDYKGYSLSISDIIKINDRYFYCQPFGFIELDKNFKPVELKEKII